MKYFSFVAVALLLTLLTSSCGNDTLQQTSKTDEALLVWSGEYMVDGCGFHVVINDRQYKPVDEEAIDAIFKTDEPTPVILSYELTGETINRPCGLSPESREMDAIRIQSIKRKY